MWCKAEQNNQNAQAPPRSTPGIEDTNLVFEIDFNHQRPEARPELQDSQWHGFLCEAMFHPKHRGKQKQTNTQIKQPTKVRAGLREIKKDVALTRLKKAEVFICMEGY